MDHETQKIITPIPKGYRLTIFPIFTNEQVFQLDFSTLEKAREMKKEITHQEKEASYADTCKGME